MKPRPISPLPVVRLGMVPDCPSSTYRVSFFTSYAYCFVLNIFEQSSLTSTSDLAVVWSGCVEHLRFVNKYPPSYIDIRRSSGLRLRTALPLVMVL